MIHTCFSLRADQQRFLQRRWKWKRRTRSEEKKGRGRTEEKERRKWSVQDWRQGMTGLKGRKGNVEGEGKTRHHKRLHEGKWSDKKTITTEDVSQKAERRRVRGSVHYPYYLWLPHSQQWPISSGTNWHFVFVMLWKQKLTLLSFLKNELSCCLRGLQHEFTLSCVQSTTPLTHRHTQTHTVNSWMSPKRWSVGVLEYIRVRLPEWWCDCERWRLLWITFRSHCSLHKLSFTNAVGCICNMTNGVCLTQRAPLSLRALLTQTPTSCSSPE